MNLTFNKGKNADLPSSNLKEGSFYLTTDKHELWFANSSSTKFKISDSNLALKNHKHDWNDINNPPNFALNGHNHDDRYYTESEINTKLANFPSKTGSGASGTWGINITGSADNATYLKDKTNGTASYLDYGDNAISNPTYLAGWDGYILKAVNKSDLSVNYANSAGNADTVDGYHAASLFKTSGGHISGSVSIGDKENLTYTDLSIFRGPAQLYLCGRYDGQGIEIGYANSGSVQSGLMLTDNNMIASANFTIEEDKNLQMRYNGKEWRTIFNHNNGNISINAAGVGLYLGYWDTQEIYCRGSYINIDSGNIGSQSVNYASSAGNSDTVDGHHFHWSGQGGQPAWVWGGNDSTNQYVYNPSNFSVNYASSAGSAKYLAEQNCSNTNFNDLKTTGVYYGYTGMANSAYGTISTLEVLKYSPDWVVQKQYSISGEPRIWIRNRHSGSTWSGWSQINVVRYGWSLPGSGYEGDVYYKLV